MRLTSTYQQWHQTTWKQFSYENLMQKINMRYIRCESKYIFQMWQTTSAWKTGHSLVSVICCRSFDRKHSWKCWNVDTCWEQYSRPMDHTLQCLMYCSTPYHFSIASVNLSKLSCSLNFCGSPSPGESGHDQLTPIRPQIFQSPHGVKGP